MKTSKAVTIAATLFALATTSSIAGAAKAKHQHKFCTALNNVKADMTKLESLGPESTVQELRSTLDDARKNINTVEKEARRIKTPAAKQFTQSADQLNAESRNIPGNMTVAQAKSRISDDLRNVDRSARALASESGCPEAMQEEMGGATQPQGTQPRGAQPQAPQGTQPQGSMPQPQR